MPVKKFGWYDSDYSGKKASTRIRVLKPIEELRSRSVDVEIINRKNISSYDAVIISKIYDKNAVKITDAAELLGKPVVMDICDNIIERASRLGQKSRVRTIEHQLRRAKIITTATDELKRALVQQLPCISKKLFVVPDMLESLPTSYRKWPSSYIRMKKLDAFINKNRNSLHCVWFGKSSGSKSGLSHLNSIMRNLEIYNEKYGLTLTIVSNSRSYYREISKDWRIPHSYIEWKINEFSSVLKRHRAALIPVANNEYTVGKTINRPATAILAGIGVLAGSIPSYEELREYIYIDNWDMGLISYRNHWDVEQLKIEEARKLIVDEYGSEAIACVWTNILDRAVSI